MKEAISHKKRLSATRLDPARPPTGRDYDADSARRRLKKTRASAATYSPRFLASLRYTTKTDPASEPLLGDYLYDEGEDSGAFYVVLSGSLKDLGTAVIKSDGEVLGFDDYSLTRPRHAAVVALDRVVAVIFNQRTLDAIGRRDAHVLSTIVRAAASSGHDQL